MHKGKRCSDCGTRFTPTNRSVAQPALCLVCAIEYEEPARAQERAEAQAKGKRGNHA